MMCAPSGRPGIVVSNSILLVEFAQRKTEEGLSPVEAAVEAGRIRMRPILMTSIATVLGLAPMAFNLGTGGEANVPLARAVIGGLCVSTFLTLFLVPCLHAMTRRAKAEPGGRRGDSGGGSLNEEGSNMRIWIVGPALVLESGQ
jgi:Cu/Ag efflux pump CusA